MKVMWSGGSRGQQSVRRIEIGGTAGTEPLRGGAVERQPPGVDQQHPVGATAEQLGLMPGGDHGRTAVGSTPEFGDDIVTDLRIELVEWFIEHEQCGIGEQRHGQCHPSALATGEPTATNGGSSMESHRAQGAMGGQAASAVITDLPQDSGVVDRFTDPERVGHDIALGQEPQAPPQRDALGSVSAHVAPPDRH